MYFKRSLVTLCAAMAASLSAQAAFQFELTEVGPDVVLTGSGALNLNSLQFVLTGAYSQQGGMVEPSRVGVQVGAPFSSMTVYKLTGVVGSLSAFGSGGWTPASAASGDLVGFWGDSSFLGINLPVSYGSGTSLSGTATFANQTFASLGITPGTYTWSWGSGATADSVTLTAAVPEPSTYAMALAGLGILGVWARRQKRISQRPAEAATA